MRVIVYKDENQPINATVKIKNESFSRKDIAEIPKGIYTGILTAEKEEVDQKFEGFVCKINPVRLNDIRNWPPDDLKLCKFLPGGTEISIKKLVTTVVADLNVPKDEVQWEYFGKVEN